MQISLRSWEQLRRVAFRSHKPMGALLEELITKRV